MPQVVRDRALAQQFDRDGYVAVPMLEPHEVAELLEALARLDPADAWAPDGSGPAMNSYHCSFLDRDKTYKRAAYALLAKSFDGVIARYLDDFRALSANFYVKPTGQGLIPVHQNWPVLDSLDATSVTVWCPLVDVDARNGTLHVVPGSHKLLPHIEGPGSLSYFSDYRDALDEHLVALSAPAGHGFIFDDSIVHGSPDNRASDPRIAVQITCIPTAARPVFYFRTDETFELIDADVDFYLDNSVDDLVARSDAWESRARVASRNRQVDKREFTQLLDRKRRGGSPRQGLWARLFGTDRTVIAS
ncbi:phytanoyl-CoA dioxygenase family protein [Sphingorhabdus soli]|uniref:Phytanoyl-CoA dioxygenase family protein n=1 Tax=Flavisphingopyxis soli TaxID=2601267 RepID=A0A5C6UN07_9SPHN|nr:phytanoyl-CoA dioxygenase family protein [Sphingorhabdus soli]TXC74349.1 phytanoyl-CoA dioxygenase family protein [Sphingorhabdus soli]